MKKSAHAAICVFVLLGLVGCQDAADPAVMQQRSKYLLDEELTGAIDVAQAREQVADERMPIVLIGRVGAGADSTWDPGKAAFVIRDPSLVESESDHDTPGHDPENCPFCQAKKTKSPDLTALIRVVDNSGNVVAIDARKLLPIEEDQLVVVQGTAEVDDLGNLVVAADGVYIRR